MSIHDRDWYRKEVKAREQAANSAVKTRRNAAAPGSRRRAFGWTWSGVLAVIAFAVIAAIARDMKDRSVPFTFQGLRWWLSLWI